ncbi:MAG: tetratricopeptide repeat protein [Chloroflexota bacterium]|nr:tetratricopeptide repeat protein [Chloroflexota bacterium]
MPIRRRSRITILGSNAQERRAGKLPSEPSPIVGREREIEAACNLLRQDGVRLVTLTGPGGTGKTRLGVQVAGKLPDAFEDGVFFVALAAVSDPALVSASIAQALGLMETGDVPLIQNLKNYLYGKNILLVLDNFEQVLESAVTVADILSDAPGLKVLVTSRARLHIRGEHEFPVPPLALPDIRHLPPLERLAQYEAVRLFIERATALKPDFSLITQNAPAVAEICVRLDGLPLAIELAAARTKILSPEAILSRLGSRLKLLTGGEKDLPARHQTLRNAIEWSYDLLDEEEKALFRRVSIFSGNRSLEAIEAICGPWSGQSSPGPAGNRGGFTLEALDVDILDGLASLVDKNLLRSPSTANEGEPRFEMLETIQEYAREKLAQEGGTGTLQQRHADYFLLLAERAEPELRGSKQVEWVQRLEVEHDNLRAALKWLLETGETERTLLLSAGLTQFWKMHGHLTEGRNWLEAALAVSSVPTTAHARALMAVGTLASTQGDYVRARTALEESVEMFRKLQDKVSIAHSLRNLGNEARLRGDYDTAYSSFKEGLAIARELRDKWSIANFLSDLGIVTQTLGDDAAAGSLYEESLQIKRELGDKRGIAMTLVNLGELARAAGQYEPAYALYSEGLTLARELGDRSGIGMVLHNLGHVAYHREEYEHALDLFTESLSIFYELRNKRDVAYCLAALGGLFGAQGRPERAVVLFSATQALSKTISSHLDAADLIEYERNITAAHSQLSQVAWDRAWERGQAMTLDQAVSFALTSALPDMETNRSLQTAPLPDEPSLKTGPLGEHPSELTERELDVLRLVALGLTDPQVAERLVISPRTVHRHLSSIYSKLGVTTRTAAARTAGEHSLL